MACMKRLALALPLTVAMTMPASANLFFDFNISGTFAANTFGNNDPVAMTVVGSTSDDSNPNASVDFQLSVTAPGSKFSGFQRYFNDNYRYGTSNAAITANESVTLDFSLVQANQYAGSFATNDDVFIFRGLVSGSPVNEYFLLRGTAIGEPVLYYTSNVWGGANNRPNFRTDQTTGFATASGTTFTAELVPEINGSGIAYIAFILGALGLWVYGGGVTGRREEVAAA